MFLCPTRKSGTTYSIVFERYLAAKWCGYPLERFELLDVDTQCMHIAAYRIYNQIQAVEQFASERDAERLAKNTRRKR